MKAIKKVLIVFSKIILIGLVVLIGLFAYFKYISINCDEGFTTDFLGKEIRFPLSLKEANEKYGLQSNGLIGYSITPNDTILVVDTHQTSRLGLYSFVFYLRDMSSNNIEDLKRSLELKYNQKFKKKAPYTFCEYLKINDYTYLSICNVQFKTKELTEIITKLKIPKDDTKITCRVSFFHNMSDNHLPGLSGMTGEAIGIYPYHFGLMH